MRLDLYDRVLGMYSSGMLLKSVAEECGVSVKYVSKLVNEGRVRGDVRARYRRPPGVSVGVLLKGLFEGVDGGVLSWEDLRLSLWPVDGERPSTWRTVVRLGVSDCRKRFGMNIVSDRKLDGYRLVK